MPKPEPTSPSKVSSSSTAKARGYQFRSDHSFQESRPVATEDFYSGRTEKSRGLGYPASNTSLYPCSSHSMVMRA